MKIFELLDELQEEIDNAKSSLFGGKKLDAELVGEILEDMRAAIPEDIQRAQAIIEQEEEILASAKEKAQDVLDGVDNKLAEMIEENKVTQLAYEKSNRMLDIANKQASDIKNGANLYAVDVLEDVASYLREYIDIVNENKSNFIKRQKSTQDQSSF